MNDTITDIIRGEQYEKKGIERLLLAKGSDLKELFEAAATIKKDHVGKEVYFRGLLEYSNICFKNCYYCGIRNENKNVLRYTITQEEIREAVNFALRNNINSFVIQSGERTSSQFTEEITKIISIIQEEADNRARITLSCGEQKTETYKKWFEAGAIRYLLRIESSNEKLYKTIHPIDKYHQYQERVLALHRLKKTGYQTGTGVMIGIPGQTIEDLAQDLLFMKDMDVDMVGMGPFIEHENTPLYQKKNELLSLNERYLLSLKMIAILRLIMKDINIASTTALQAINIKGKQNALQVGANVIMPNLTPLRYKESYRLYKDKPGSDLTIHDELCYAIEQIEQAGSFPAYNKYGDALHFVNKKRILVQ